METHDLFDAYQSAYRPHHSCETAIVRIQDDILKSLDSHKYVILVLLDLSSAFDSVDHDILMNKLYKIGVRGRAYNWVKSYLSSRTQAVEIGEAISKTIHLHCEYHKEACSDRFSLIYTALILPMYSVTTHCIITCMRTTHNCMWSFLMGRWSTLHQMLSACHGVSLT